MNSVISTIRAVGTEFAHRTVRGLLKPFVIGAALVAAVSIWLVHFNAWWLVVTVPLFLAISLGIGILLTASLVVRKFTPKLSDEQRLGVSGFVDKLQRVSENVQVPIFVVVYRVARDIVRPRENGYVSTLAKDSSSLHKDLLNLQKLF